MVFYIGLLACILGMVYSTYKTLSNRNLLSPQMFVFAGLLLFLYIPAVLLQSRYIGDEKYNLTILFGVIGAWTAALIFPYDYLDKNPEVEIYDIHVNNFRIFSYIYVVYLLYGILRKILQYGSIIAAFRVNRLDNYLGQNIVSESAAFTIIIEGLKIFYYLYIAYLFECKKYVSFFLLCALPMIYHRFTAVTRYDFIAMLGALVIFLIDSKLYNNNLDPEQQEDTIKGRKKKINILKIGIIAFVGIYFALLFMRVANFTRFGERASGLNLSFASLFKTSISNDSLYYEYFHYLYQAIQNHRTGFEYGLSWFVYPFVNLIPRAIWPGKPYTAFSARMTDKIYWSLTSGNPVVTFSILGEGYAEFGIIGVFIAPILFVWVRSFNFKQIKKLKYNRMYILIIMFSLLTYMRSEVPVFLTLLDGLWLYIIPKFFMYKPKYNN